MTEESDMAAVEQLRRLEQGMGKLIEDVGGPKRRLTSSEALFGAINRDFSINPSASKASKRGSNTLNGVSSCAVSNRAAGFCCASAHVQTLR